MTTEKKLVLSFIDFLKDQIVVNKSSPDSVESLEVAIQCLENAFGVTANESTDYMKCGSTKILDIYKKNIDKDIKLISPEQKTEADDHKNKGNDLIKLENAQEALEHYNKAILIDDSDPIYYCNRAAAYLKLNDVNNAIKDCQKALQLNPSYGKAYGRLGLAYIAAEKFTEAKSCYEKALSLEPSNESYQNNLKIVIDKLADAHMTTDKSGTAQSIPGGMGCLGNIFGISGAGGVGGGSTNCANNLDFGAMLNNPALINMATNLMADHNIQKALSGMLNNTTTTTSNSPGNLDAFLNIGQQLASQIQNRNPELISQLRNQFTSLNPPPHDPQSAENITNINHHNSSSNETPLDPKPKNADGNNKGDGEAENKKNQ
ncbi:unnamed protein product [Gordionus sp. m RMFG-2023]